MHQHQTQTTPATPAPIAPDTTLADLACAWAGASRVFVAHGLDFCCKGAQPLAAACQARGIDPELVLAQLRQVANPLPAADRWDHQPTPDLIAHILDRYHRAHREELPHLLSLAKKVEAVHRNHPHCPTGLTDHLRHIATELELHMQKEENVLFPWILQDAPVDLRAPISCMLAEHDQHGANLVKLRNLAHDYQPPSDACPTWRALYLGLEGLEREVMEHVHLENHVLFGRCGG